MKKITVLLLCAVLALCLGTGAMAAGSVTYDGSAQDFIFAPGSSKSPTDLFEDFKNIMPGDSLTEEIVIKNTLDSDMEIKVYLRSLGEAGESTEDFLAQLTLTVRQDGAELFNATAEKTDGLTDWVLLGTFKAGEEASLALTLSAPITMGNEFANAVGYIDWQFKVEEFPIEQPEPTPEPTPEPSETPAPSPTAAPVPGSDAPKTGDDRPVLLLGGVVLLCAAAMIVLLSQRKRSKAD